MKQIRLRFQRDKTGSLNSSVNSTTN